MTAATTARLIPQINPETAVCAQCKRWLLPGTEYNRLVIQLDTADAGGNDLCPSCTRALLREWGVN